MGQLVDWIVPFARFLMGLMDGEYVIFLKKRGKDSTWRIAGGDKEMRA